MSLGLESLIILVNCALWLGLPQDRAYNVREKDRIVNVMIAPACLLYGNVMRKIMRDLQGTSTFSRLSSSREVGISERRSPRKKGRCSRDEGLSESDRTYIPFPRTGSRTVAPPAFTVVPQNGRPSHLRPSRNVDEGSRSFIDSSSSTKSLSNGKLREGPIEKENTLDLIERIVVLDRSKTSTPDRWLAGILKERVVAVPLSPSPRVASEGWEEESDLASM
uniref:Uncharacterized protein n=1 Tax=Vespula pensylvanica TaxID=30213 RepID=A0A834UAS6_VESPE|nr:hypothetical protein H0235_006643 [Vespula pensylvanica]